MEITDEAVKAAKEELVGKGLLPDQQTKKQKEEEEKKEQEFVQRKKGISERVLQIQREIWGIMTQYEATEDGKKAAKRMDCMEGGHSVNMLATFRRGELVPYENSLLEQKKQMEEFVDIQGKRNAWLISLFYVPDHGFRTHFSVDYSRAGGDEDLLTEEVLDVLEEIKDDLKNPETGVKYFIWEE